MHKLFHRVYVRAFNAELSIYVLGYNNFQPIVSFLSLARPSWNYAPVVYIQHVFKWWDTKFRGAPITAETPNDFAIMIQLVNNKY